MTHPPPILSLRRDNNLHGENILTTLKLLFTRNTGPISIILWTNHTKVQMVSSLFKWKSIPRGDNSIILKMNWTSREAFCLFQPNSLNKGNSGKGGGINWGAYFSNGRKFGNLVKKTMTKYINNHLQNHRDNVNRTTGRYKVPLGKGDSLKFVQK